MVCAFSDPVGPLAAVRVSARLQAAESLIFATAQRMHAQATVLRPTLVYGAGRDRTLTQIAALGFTLAGVELATRS